MHMKTRSYNDKDYVMEKAITGDVALIKACKSDALGNLVFRGTAQNFNSECANDAKYCTAEVIWEFYR